MKTCLFFLVSFILAAQAPPPASPETVIGKVDGKEVTMGDVQHLLETFPPQFMQQFQRDPARAIQDAFIVKYVASEGEKLKLADQDPLKEQIENMRMQLVAQGMISHERNFFTVSMESMDEYYRTHQSRFESATIKIIKIAFKPGGGAPKSVEEAAKEAVEGAHAGSNRSEADAKKLAAEVVKKLHDGADFVRMVAEYSDDNESKMAAGDFGTVKPTSAYTEDFKKAVFALKPGEVSNPVPTGNALYIVRVEKRSVQPLNDVRPQVMDELKEAHLNEYISSLQKRFTPQIERPELLVQMNINMGQRPPAK